MGQVIDFETAGRAVYIRNMVAQIERDCAERSVTFSAEETLFVAQTMYRASRGISLPVDCAPDIAPFLRPRSRGDR